MKIKMKIGIKFLGLRIIEKLISINLLDLKVNMMKGKNNQ
jgi:hypothetical protein